jgi:dolichyl-phosphate-mannose-protein mannosyltransferase
MKLSNKFAPLGVFLLSYLVKVHKIEKGNFVIWDEAHFGKFSQSYLDRTFYFDVHPPLGKLLTALSGFIYGQSDKFLFSSKEKFPDDFDYVGMRRFHALISSLVPLFAYLILREFGFSILRSFLCSLFFIFDNGMTCISRLILLDSHLLSFTAGTTYMMVILFSKTYRKTPKINISTPQKIKPSKALKDASPGTLLSLGCFIGCVISIKWIGCLTMLFVGIFVIYDLYKKLLFLDIKGMLKYFMRRAFYLIAVPAAIYIFFFYIHFRIANKSGPDDGFMSCKFQLSLANNSFENTRKYISFGKVITIKAATGYLHSHNHTYPDSQEQDFQITTYQHRDKNNNYFMQKVSDDMPVSFVSDKDRIVIYHDQTQAYLCATDEQAYVSSGKKVVGKSGPPNQFCIWEIIIADDFQKKEKNVKSLTTKFYLRNVETNCYLTAPRSNYPSWGFNQGEITCTEEQSSSSLFNIEENFHSEADNNPIYTGISSSFISNFIEHHILMFTTNRSFKQDSDLEPDKIVSKPYEWALLKRGLRMTQWGENHKFYMFMNPLLHYIAVISVLSLPIVIFARKIKKSRKVELVGKKDISKRKHDYISRREFFVFVAFFGWAIHYIPFFFVGRVLYFHHYLPALFFSLLGFCFLIRKMSYIKLVPLIIAIISAFTLYSPLTYGFLEEQKVQHLKVFKSWDFTD